MYINTHAGLHLSIVSKCNITKIYIYTHTVTTKKNMPYTFY